MRCAEELIGTNSVTPCMSPRTAACRRLIGSLSTGRSAQRAPVPDRYTAISSEVLRRFDSGDPDLIDLDPIDPGPSDSDPSDSDPIDPP